MARLELLTLLAALAVQTRHIGLAATASTTFSDPFNLARSFSSLDHHQPRSRRVERRDLFSGDVARNFSRENMPRTPMLRGGP